MPNPLPSTTVVITTKNRKDDLAVALESTMTQTARPQVLVIDDGSTDGTAEMVRERFPSVRVDRAEQSMGYIVQRNRAAQLASTDIIVSIDDDAIFSTPQSVEQTLAEFDLPRVGAVAMPVIDVNISPDVRQRAPGDGGIYATCAYIGTAHALRRELFLRLGGYREYLFHQGEEGDLSVRMLQAGYVVRMGRADPIHHFESPKRDFRRRDLYGRRNDLLVVWYNVPMPYMPLHLLATSANGVRFGIRCGRPLRMLHGVINGYGAILHEFPRRRPVSGKTYRLSRMLTRRQAIPMEEMEEILGPLPADIV